MRSASPRIARRVSALALLGLLAACSSTEAVAPSSPPAESPPVPAPPSLEIGGIDDVATISAHGVSFEYPKRWRVIPIRKTIGGIPVIWTRKVGIGIDNLVGVSAYRLKHPIDPDEIGAAEASLRELLEDALQKRGGAIDTGPDEVTVGSLPGFGYSASMPTSSSGVGRMRALLVVDERTLYAFVCEFSPRHQSQILEGCDVVTTSFQP